MCGRSLRELPFDETRRQGVLLLPTLSRTGIAAFAAAGLLAWAATAHAANSNFAFQVEEWAVDWDGFEDAFEDGVFPDGGPGEPLHYVACGVGDSRETGGALMLSGPDLACDEGVVFASTAFPIPSEGKSYATYRFGPLPLNTASGLQVVSADAANFVALLLIRSAAGLEVWLFADDPVDPNDLILLQSALISSNPDSDPSLANIEALELRLELSLDPVSPELVPEGQYRLCLASPCEPETTTPFLDLIDVTPPAAGALDAGEPYLPMLFAFSDGTAFAFQVEEWRIEARASDDFEDGVFAARAPYAFGCGDASYVDETGGMGFTGALPSEVTASASYAFEIADRCTGYGLTIGSAETQFPADISTLVLVRSEDLDDPASGMDALQVLLFAEPEDPEAPGSPIVARATISTNPDGDPALANVERIEFLLDASRDSPADPLLPMGEFRLCDGTGCPPSFEALLPHTPAIDPEALVCGAPIGESDPPADGGVIATPEALAAALVAFVERICGDVNGSGEVNVGDALLVSQLEAGLRECGVAPFDGAENCDVAPEPGGNGVCDIGDALFMAQCDARLRSCVFDCIPFECPAPAAATEPSAAGRGVAMAPAGGRLLVSGTESSPGESVEAELDIQLGPNPLGAVVFDLGHEPAVLEALGATGPHPEPWSQEAARDGGAGQRCGMASGPRPCSHARRVQPVPPACRASGVPARRSGTRRARAVGRPDRNARSREDRRACCRGDLRPPGDSPRRGSVVRPRRRGSAGGCRTRGFRARRPASTLPPRP
jgi:hypothetical protein